MEDRIVTVKVCRASGFRAVVLLLSAAAGAAALPGLH